MKIFSASQIRQWDNATIDEQNIPSVDLMERAAMACFQWISLHIDKSFRFSIFCGSGNNGGDGLALARIMHQKGYAVRVFRLYSSSVSPDCMTNLERLINLRIPITVISDKDDFPDLESDLIIEAIFGTGLTRKPEGISSELIEYLNKNARAILSIDMPAGMFTDRSSIGNPIIESDFLLTFQSQKLAFLMPENAPYIKQISTLDIGLSAGFMQETSSAYELLTLSQIRQIYRPRNAHAHKGNFGHLNLIAGSYGMMGAAVLSAGAALRSGVGKLTCVVPQCGYTVMQATVPEAMCRVSGFQAIENLPTELSFDAIGAGPGLGQNASVKNMLQSLFHTYDSPCVLDADALNVLGESPEFISQIPSHSILTPHPKEFERLFGKTANDFETLHLASAKAKELSIFIVLKGHHTFIASPEGNGYFNSTGNAGMATAGAGDVLTGIISSLLAQKYSSAEAAMLGVYLHGLAGDLAASALSQEAMKAGDIIDFLPTAFKKISTMDSNDAER